MSMSRGEFEAAIKALIAARREAVITELTACEPTGTPDPDETPEFMAEVIVQHEVSRANGEKGTPHEEFTRDLLTPSWRWDAYVADAHALPADEGHRLDAAAEIVRKAFGISPGYHVRASEAPGKSAKLADIIAILVLQRELWARVPPE
jgi:hypothetical protein